MVLINGVKQDSISVTDRGLQYGDGLFETMAVRNGVIPLWDKHWQRLTLGCKKLQITCPSKVQVEKDIATLLQQLKPEKQRSVVKLIVTRGSGPRGYRYSKEQAVTRILSAHSWVPYPEDYKTNGVNVCYCRSTISENKTLAGIKHLNRLEQVLARNEWDNEYQEGLMLNTRGHVIDGTMSNLFIVKNKQLITPDLHLSGVAGVMREMIIELARNNAIEVQENVLFAEDIQQADEVFLTNSLFGIWPVKALANKQFTPAGEITQQLQSNLTQLDIA